MEICSVADYAHHARLNKFNIAVRGHDVTQIFSPRMTPEELIGNDGRFAGHSSDAIYIQVTGDPRAAVRLAGWIRREHVDSPIILATNDPKRHPFLDWARREGLVDLVTDMPASQASFDQLLRNVKALDQSLQRKPVL